MKKIFALMLVLSLFGVVVKAEPVKHKIETRTLPSFQIFAEDADSLRQNMPIIEFEGKNGFSLFRFEKYIDSKGSASFRLMLDKKSKRVALKITDKDYFDQLYNIFVFTSNKYFVSNSPMSQLAVTAFFGERVDFSDTLVNCCTSVIYKKDLDKQSKYIVIRDKSTPFKTGTICFIDDSFQIEWCEPSNGSMKTIRREAINPDDYNDYNIIPGLDRMLTTEYKVSSSNYAIGYIELTPGSDIYYLNGDKFDYNWNTDLLVPIQTKNSKSMVYYYFLEKLLFCQNLTINKYVDGIFFGEQIQRLYYDKEKKEIRVLKVSFFAGSKKYENNGKIMDFLVAPYDSNVGLMVPLKEVCEALKAKVIYRPLDGTILISRFFEY